MNARAIKRTTTVQQVVKCDVDLGPMPEAACLEKLRVKRKLDGREMFINLDDYDMEGDKPTAKYAQGDYIPMLDYDPDLALLGREGTTMQAESSLFSPDELAKMPIRLLRELPEFSRIPPHDRPKLLTKQLLVDAILDQRHPAAEPTHREAL